MKGRTKFLLVTGILVALSVAAMSNFRVRWRVQFVAMKLLGRASYMSWEDVARVVRGGPPAISAVSAADVQAGGDLFSHQCSQCHGADARGGSGPDLTNGQFRHGGSDADLLQIDHAGCARHGHAPPESFTSGRWPGHRVPEKRGRRQGRGRQHPLRDRLSQPL